MAFHKYANDAEIIADKIPAATSENETAAIARLNESVSAAVDAYCKRPPGYFLPASATATPRNFRGRGTHILPLPVHVFGTVEVSGFAGAGAAGAFYENEVSGFLYRGTPNGGANWIGNLSEIATGADGGAVWTKGAIYSVSARWGYAETPAPIIEAVKQIVARWFAQGQGTFGEVSPTGFVIERSAPPSAILLLNPFVRGEYEL